MSCFDNVNNMESIRPLKKENTVGARDMFADVWTDFINMYGIGTNYYVHGYTLENHDAVYGESPTEPFHAPKQLNIHLEFQSDALLLAKFGIETNADVIGMISVKDYRNVFGINAEPKSGDVIELYESAWTVEELPEYTDSVTQETTGFDAKTLLCEFKDMAKVASIAMEMQDLYGFRYVRHPQLFEITEIKYQDFTQSGMNALQGHYVWKIHAKRFDYSFEPGINGENPPQSVHDTDIFGQLDTEGNTPTPDKQYPDNVDDEGDDKVWDYDEKGTDTSDYGYY